MCIKMKFSFQFVAFLFAVVVCVANGDSEEHDTVWNDYKLKHGKDYTTFFGGGWRDKMRKGIFLVERELVNQHNSNESRSYSQGLNRFSDMRPSEKSKYLGVKSSMAPSIQFMKSIPGDDDLRLQNRKSLPEALDYRTDNCMAAVKDQKSCGSCWAFAAVAPIEFNYCKKHKQIPTVLSEQQLVDCDKLDAGCKGGWPTMTWKYIKLAGGITPQSLYPYTATQNVCPRWFWYSVAGAQVFKFSYVPTQNAMAMQVALQKHGPLAVSFAVANSFFAYRNGVYDSTDCDNVDVNHAIVVVGWGNQSGIDYWIVRNSWGTDWGQSGYGLIHRGVNKCKIESYPAYVIPF